MLRAVIKEDLSVFFEQQRSPTACFMAAFTRENPADRDAFDRHWEKVLRSDSIIKKTILFGNEIAGYVSKFEMAGQSEISYWIGSEFWGKGVATQALTEFVNDIGVRPLYARTAFDNLASMRVLQKCGFTREGVGRFFANARGEEIDEIIWVLAGAK